MKAIARTLGAGRSPMGERKVRSREGLTTAMSSVKPSLTSEHLRALTGRAVCARYDPAVRRRWR